MTDVELFEALAKKFSLKKETFKDQYGRYGLQLRVFGKCDDGKNEYSFLSPHRETEAECVSDFLEWLFFRSKTADSPEKRCGNVCMATSRSELELKLSLTET